MTICIAAMAENNTRLVIATDQMITFNVPMPYQYETDDVRKTHYIGENVLALSAGNAAFAFDILTNVRKKISMDQSHTVEEVAEIARLEYQAFRRTIMVQHALEPRGLDLATYYTSQQSFVPAIVQQIDNDFATYQLGVDAIIAGHNDDDCHIYSLLNPGTLVSHDSIGFPCVGIGAPHATYHLIGSDYKKSLPRERVEQLVREAKAKSEKAPGVGAQTEVFYLPKEGESHA